ncbi:hypothetical protein L6R29_03305 [Myxococcota bacterium]|nr:hypothetical protein [Myxococcota bacterium]
MKGTLLTQRHLETLDIMKDVLQENYLHVRLENFRVEERGPQENSQILSQIRRSDRNDLITLEGEGSGALHGFFVALRDHLSEEFPSVRAIHFTSIRAESVPNSNRNHPTDAEAEVFLTIRNSYGDELEFRNRSRSLMRATLDCIVDAVEYFVNSEKAYVQIYRALNHYREQGRSDLVDKYTSLLSVVVRSTSYTEVIEQLKKAK